jgi:hypothetical protein
MNLGMLSINHPRIIHVRNGVAQLIPNLSDYSTTSSNIDQLSCRDQIRLALDSYNYFLALNCSTAILKNLLDRGTLLPLHEL